MKHVRLAVTECGSSRVTTTWKHCVFINGVVTGSRAFIPERLMKLDESNQPFRLAVTTASKYTTRLSWQRTLKGTHEMMEFETDRLILRTYTMDDLDFFASLWADPEVIRFIGEGVTRSLPEAEERLKRIITGYDSGFGLLAAWHKVEKRLTGHAGLVRQEVDGRNEIELGYWLARDFWGQGLATEPALALRDHAFTTLGLHRIISLIEPGNAASIAVAERVGMHHEQDVVFRRQQLRVYSINRE